MGELGRVRPRPGELGREVTGLEGREKHRGRGERGMGRTRVRVETKVPLSKTSVWRRTLRLALSPRVREEGFKEVGGVDNSGKSDAESGEESRVKVKDSEEPSEVMTGELLRDETELSSASPKPVWMLRLMRFVC